jgi:hypothetical protein
MICGARKIQYRKCLSVKLDLLSRDQNFPFLVYLLVFLFKGDVLFLAANYEDGVLCLIIPSLIQTDNRRLPTVSLGVVPPSPLPLSIVDIKESFKKYQRNSISSQINVILCLLPLPLSVARLLEISERLRNPWYRLPLPQ